MGRVSPWQETLFRVYSIFNHHLSVAYQEVGACYARGNVMNCLHEAPPFTRETLAVFLGFVHSVSPDIAVALYLGFVCLLRTGEILSLQSRDILIPSDGSTVILFLGETKTAPRNPHAGTVVAHDLVLTHLLQKWKRVSQEDAFLVPWNQTKFRTFFRDALEKCGLSKWDYKPYSLRRGGATDLWLTCRSYSQVTHTGRWTSERTAKIYIQDSVSLLTTLTFVATPKQKNSYVPLAGG